VLAIDDHGGANIYPAIWSALLGPHAQGVGGVITTVRRYQTDLVMELLEAPTEAGWTLTALADIDQDEQVTGAGDGTASRS